MARPLRIELAGAWYHVMNRGHRGGTLFRDDADRRRFLGLVAELPERFSLEVHAFVLMDNHYHLLGGGNGVRAILEVGFRGSAQQLQGGRPTHPVQNSVAQSPDELRGQLNDRR